MTENKWTPEKWWLRDMPNGDCEYCQNVAECERNVGPNKWCLICDELLDAMSDNKEAAVPRLIGGKL